MMDPMMKVMSVMNILKSTTTMVPERALRATLSGVVLGALLTACASRPELDPAVPWSTKAHSVLPSEPGLTHLNIPKPTEKQGVPDVRRAAVDLLMEATESTNPLLRANAIEAMHAAPERLEAPVRLALADPNRGVRFVAAMTVGKKQMRTLTTLVDPLLDDPSDSVRAAAIYALRRCGVPADPTPLANMALSDDPEVKANAVLILGELGDATAMPILRSAARGRSSRVSPIRARIIELQIAEAMVRLGADDELAAIRAAVFSPPEQGELSVLATLMLGRLNDRTYAASLVDRATRVGRDQEPAEVRLAAVQSVAQMDPRRAPGDVAREYVANERFELRQQSAVTLGWLPAPEALPTLTTMMGDTNPLVQVAAAGAVLRTTATGAAQAGGGRLVDMEMGGR